jgi:hypothetical protein
LAFKVASLRFLLRSDTQVRHPAFPFAACGEPYRQTTHQTARILNQKIET